MALYQHIMIPDRNDVSALLSCPPGSRARLIRELFGECILPFGGWALLWRPPLTAIEVGLVLTLGPGQDVGLIADPLGRLQGGTIVWDCWLPSQAAVKLPIIQRRLSKIIDHSLHSLR